jgi:hypothetical protein
MFEIGVAIKKKNIFTSYALTEMLKFFKYIYKCVFIYHQIVKKKSIYSNIIQPENSVFFKLMIVTPREHDILA